MAATLQKIKDLLSALKLGETVRVANVDLVAAEIAGIAEFDHKAQAEWLTKQLPFRCEFKEVPDTGAIIFTRAE